MIKVSFQKNGNQLTGFSVKGHSGYAESGSDIVCAAVSSMVMLTVNAICGEFGAEADVKTDEKDASVSLKLKNDGSQAFGIAVRILNSFRGSVQAVSEEYPDFVKIIGG